jgi:hypothetical protein
MNLGKMNSSLAFHCGVAGCTWFPEDGKLVMKTVQPHFEEKHPGDPVSMLAFPKCPCGQWMDFLASRPTGGARSKDYFVCPVCGNTGFVIVEMGGEPQWRKTPV